MHVDVAGAVAAEDIAGARILARLVQPYPEQDAALVRLQVQGVVTLVAKPLADRG